MATLRIDNLPDELYQSIQTLATNASVSLNDAAIQLLMQATQLSRPSEHQVQISDLAEMAADPDIQRELAVINAESTITRLDGNSGDAQAAQLRQIRETLDSIQNFPRKNPADYGLADSTQLIREDRAR